MSIYQLADCGEQYVYIIPYRCLFANSVVIRYIESIAIDLPFGDALNTSRHLLQVVFGDHLVSIYIIFRLSQFRLNRKLISTAYTR